jgi:uncharacterized protein (DUF305 family)
MGYSVTSAPFELESGSGPGFVPAGGRANEWRDQHVPIAGPSPFPLARSAYMNPLRRRGGAGALVAVAALLAISSPARAQEHRHAGHDMGMPAVVIPQGAIYTEADVRFMQGMIAHHAQAIYMSRLAAGRQASPRLLKFATKIDQSQQAEIRLMQEWLHANGHFAPDTSAWHTMTMAGMLTIDQLKLLDTARGEEFDRLFLRFMIQHHQGALKMVKDLFATPRAGQDVDVSVFANDVETVQTAEIGTMYQMLNDL